MTFLTESESSQLLDLCVQVLQAFKQDKEAKLEQFEAERKKMDPEDEELFMQQLEKANRVYSYVMDLSGTLLKCMPEQCSPQVRDKILPIYSKSLLNLNAQTNLDDSGVLDALCLLCDCLEFGN